MNLFEEIGEELFRPLTGINKRKYVDLCGRLLTRHGAQEGHYRTDL